jgi:hypothetical protein
MGRKLWDWPALILATLLAPILTGLGYVVWTRRRRRRGNRDDLSRT